jgi:hypothetical protein
MKKYTTEQQAEALTNFLRNVSENQSLFICSVNKGKNSKFCIAEKTETVGTSSKSKLMTYEEMNHYFFGVLAVKNKSINF